MSIRTSEGIYSVRYTGTLQDAAQADYDEEYDEYAREVDEIERDLDEAENDLDEDYDEDREDSDDLLNVENQPGY